MFRIYDDTKIYVFCRSGSVTGGPEAVHQLVGKLIKFGLDAYIVYLPKIDNPVPEEYKHYNVKYTDQIEDSERNILITLEVFPEKLEDYNNIQKAIWWLSVNNAQTETTKLIRWVNDNLKIKNKFLYNTGTSIYHKIKGIGKPLFNFKKNPSVFHLAQSRYAEYFLYNSGACLIFPLTDYLNKAHFVEKKVKKEDFVLYNPKKGIEIVDFLIKTDSSITWIPIQNMTPLEVSDLMARGKVYVDFGNHPGKDRIPREAAMKDCCVIVGLLGAANFSQDVSIPNDFKFDVKNLDTIAITQKIKSCFENYDTYNIYFEPYRNIIRKNEEQFELEIKSLFSL